MGPLEQALFGEQRELPHPSGDGLRCRDPVVPHLAVVITPVKRVQLDREPRRQAEFSVGTNDVAVRALKIIDSAAGRG